MFQIERKTLIQLTVAAVLAITLSLFIHDSGATFLHILRVGGKALFLPLLLSMLVFYVLDPGINILERRANVGRIYAVLLIYTVLLAGIFMLSYFFSPRFVQEMVGLKKDLPVYAQRLVEGLAQLEFFFKQDLGVFGNLDLARSFSDFLDSQRANILSFTVDTVEMAVSLLLLVPTFSFFFLVDGQEIKRSFVKMVPNQYFESVLIIFYQINKNLGVFIRGRFYEAAVVGLVSFAGLFFVDMKYIWFFAFIAGITNLVPYLGPLLSYVITGISAFLMTGSWLITLQAIGVLVFAHVVDHVILIPLLIRKTSAIHPITGLIAIIIGGKIYGAVGMVIAIPFASILKLMFIEVKRHWHTTKSQYGFLKESVEKKIAA